MFLANMALALLAIKISQCLESVCPMSHAPTLGKCAQHVCAGKISSNLIKSLQITFKA